ncbi:LysR substrate-binding domain-containing protein [Arthrobacter sp. UYEF3]|uniref:LysR substrate-binding domain-containing protein n=1 Tax=Arthrobacter sp. UYEF3 TaxID=1756365 RepID=UPI00339A598A
MARYTLRQLAHFVAVADTGAISAAALKLHLSQGAVSAAVTELERIFKVQLMVRRKAHGVTLTPAGKHLYGRAVRLLTDAEELELSAASGGTELAGPLVIGCYLTLAPTVLPPLLDGFTAAHPKVQLESVEGTQNGLLERLFDGELDLAVVYDTALPAALGAAELYKTSAYALLPAAHRLAARTEVSLHDLAPEPMVLLDAPPSSHHSLSLFERAGAEPNIRYRTTDFEVTRSLVGRGLGYSLLVQHPAVDTTYEGRALVARPLTPAVRPLSVQIIWPRAVRLTDRAQAMVEYAAGLPWGAGKP